MSIFWRHRWRQPCLLLLSLCLFSSYSLAASVANSANSNSSSANGNGYQDTQVIKRKVIRALESRLKESGIDHYQIELQALDNRLRLSACAQLDVKPGINSGSVIGRQSVEVRCMGPKPWKVYVQAQVYAEIDVPVLKHAMAAGATIGKGDIEIRRIQMVGSSQPIIRHMDQLPGKTLKRHLPAGQPIMASQISAPKLVKRGQQVSLEYELNGLKVRMAGTSHQDGAEGDWIKVVNINSGKIIEGRINAQGNVLVSH